MKYFRANIHIEARSEKEARELLDLMLKDNPDIIPDCSLHCTEHDPTIPYMWISTHTEEDPNMVDCTDGCQKETKNE